MNRHIYARVIAASSAPISAIARIVDGVSGAIALPIALLTFGQYKTINDFAINGLPVGGIIHDVSWSVRKTINPI